MIDNSKEYIACSAIHYDNRIHYMFMDSYGIDTGFVICGFRHCNIISILPENQYVKNLKEYAKHLSVEWKEGKRDENGLPDVKNESNGITYQGFMTSKGRFVDRKEAAKIAYECGQITKQVKTLYSEDIFE